MNDDAELLRQYARDRAEPAFAELVRRRIDLVYSVAVRQCGGDIHLAKDVTQRVFTDLARKAPSLVGRSVLSGWLVRSARFAASDVVRAERRRRTREQASLAMHDPSEPAMPAESTKLRPLLDEVLSELSAVDRDTIALRFLEQRSLTEVGTAFRISADAARKRVDRALERIRTMLARRGITSTAAALAVALEQQSAVAAPPSVAAAAILAAHTSATVIGVHTVKIAIIAIAGLGIAGGWVWFARRPTSTPATILAAEPVPKNRSFLERVMAKLPPAPPLPPSRPPEPRTAARIPPLEGPSLETAATMSGGPKEITIIGKVQQPGRIAWVEGSTLRQALQLAGGTTPLAAETKIRVTRKRANGSIVTFTVTIQEADTFIMLPGDDVFVPERII
jgi:RNA polymerase sigma factor (sigma-70 family)